MMAKRREPLDVWLYGKRIAQLSQPRPSSIHYRLEFTEEALDTYGVGRRILSLSLPISRQPIRDEIGKPTVTNFLEGLLPEGNLRQQLATAEKVATTDLMALLRAVGGDCAGAVQFLPPGATAADQSVRELSAQELARLVADLPTYHLPKGAHPQASLAGIQDKVLLVDLGDGRWGWPQNGAPSTHIIKPAPSQGVIQNLIESEDWALRVAHRAGLPAAQSRLQRFENRNAIVIARYDRDTQGRRIHQEDFCQALGLAPSAKYDSTTSSGPSRLARIMALASTQAKDDPTQLRRALLAAVTYNVIIGNGDAHSKNYSLLIGERGQVSLAPLYDTAPVMFIDPAFQNTGHVINGRTSINLVGIEDLVTEARAWGLSTKRAEQTVTNIVDRVRMAIEQTPVPEVLQQMRARLEQFWTRKLWSPAPDPPPPTEGLVYISAHATRSGRTVRGHWRRRR